MNSGAFDGLDFQQAVDAIAAALEKKGLGKKRVQFRLRDWGISRQRYWGTPIPIIHCAACGDVPVPDEQLPVVLPEDCVPDGSGNPLSKRADFVNCSCPKCGQPARRETDTMDTFVDSSWYFLRFACADNATAMVDERVQLLAAGRSVHRRHRARDPAPALFAFLDAGDARSRPGAARRALRQPAHAGHGAERHLLPENRRPAGSPTSIRPRSRRATDVAGQPLHVLIADGEPVQTSGIGTMSKSRNNGVDPQSLVDTLGADTARLFTMFTAPPEQSLEWSDEGVQGASRFLKRVWKAVYSHAAGGPADKVDAAALNDAQRTLRRQVHQTLAKVSDDIGRRRTFNTAIAAVMELLNSVVRAETGDAGRSRRDPGSAGTLRCSCSRRSCRISAIASGRCSAMAARSSISPGRSRIRPRCVARHGGDRRAGQWQAARTGYSSHRRQ